MSDDLGGPRELLPAPGELVRIYGKPAKKRFGQNFLLDPSVLDRIVAIAGVDAGSRVLEIGPGPGTLTVRLLAAGATVVALELDLDAVEHLAATLGGVAGFRVLAGDATGPDLDRAATPMPDVVVANLPYHVATVILFRLIDDIRPQKMALMFQREVAERVACTGPDRELGSLGVAANLRYQTRLAMRLKPGAFRPAPKVESAVVTLERRDVPLCDPEVEVATRRLARAAFEQRRKMLRGSLAGLSERPEDLLAAVDLPATARPEELTVVQFVALGAAWLEQVAAAGRQQGR